MSITKDTTAPSVGFSAVTITSSNQGAYSLSGTCSENTEDVNVSVGSINQNLSCSSNSWSHTFNTTSLTDGNISISATHGDAAGNSITVNQTVVKDTTGPTLTGLSNDGGPLKTKNWNWILRRIMWSM